MLVYWLQIQDGVSAEGTQQGHCILDDPTVDIAAVGLGRDQPEGGKKEEDNSNQSLVDRWTKPAQIYKYVTLSFSLFVCLCIFQGNALLTAVNLEFI